MRISDWSSDVCSSDLGGTATALPSVRTADIQARRARSGRAATAAPPGSRPCRSGSPLRGVSPVIAIDGKTSRRSHDKAGGKAAIHMVSAFAARQRLVLGQVKIDEQSKELPANPRLDRKSVGVGTRED